MGDAEVGAEFRLGELLLGAKVDLFAKLDSIEKRLSSIAEREQRYEEAGPVQVELRDSGTVDANQDNLYIGLGGPSYGRVWEVRQLVIGGVTWATTVAGYALFFVQPVKPSAMAGVPLANIQDAAGTGPGRRCPQSPSTPGASSASATRTTSISPSSAVPPRRNTSPPVTPSTCPTGESGRSSRHERLPARWRGHGGRLLGLHQGRQRRRSVRRLHRCPGHPRRRQVLGLRPGVLRPRSTAPPSDLGHHRHHRRPLPRCLRGPVARPRAPSTPETVWSTATGWGGSAPRQDHRTRVRLH